MRDMNPLEAEFSGRDVAFLAVNIYEDAENARSFIDGSELKYTWLRADDSVVETLGIKGVPTVFILDRDGTVVWRSGLLTTLLGASHLRGTLEKLTDRN